MQTERALRQRQHHVTPQKDRVVRHKKCRISKVRAPCDAKNNKRREPCASKGLAPWRKKQSAAKPTREHCGTMRKQRVLRRKRMAVASQKKERRIANERASQCERKIAATQKKERLTAKKKNAAPKLQSAATDSAMTRKELRDAKTQSAAKQRHR